MIEKRTVLPRLDPEAMPFWNGCREGRLRLQRCQVCGRCQYYPRSLCVYCGATELSWIDSSGRGIIWSHTTIYRAFDPAFAGLVPYTVVLVALEEGPIMMSRLVGCPPGEVRTGMPVVVCWERVSDDIAVPLFRPVAPGEP